MIPSRTVLASSSISSGTGTTVRLTGTRSTIGFATDTLTLVSPAQLFTTASGAFHPGFARLTIHLAPEPARLILLALGVGGAVALGLRRR